MPAIRTRPESLIVAVLLSVIGGFLDAYTFVGHGGVFANAQTGNVVLFGVEAAARHWRAALLHVPPILAFLVGVALAESLARPAARRVLRRPTRVVLGAEILVLAAVALLPASVPDQVATTSVAFVAALQVSTFRLLHDVAYNTTMTTGNLRTLVSSAYRWRTDRDAKAGRQAGRLGAVVAAFALGAAVGAALTEHLGSPAVLLAAGGLVLVLVLIVVETATLARRVV
ncbi:YoaK family protein [Nakamurella sp. PAMC28650]|jgi:uncharacterized membrane protein YoaK (UPF0700 family)|uniref:YoaK family protein n=1 Tax=Nakamurella sp. PAMC28650 TaxID=2762325 RepID=UPI00164E5519|nr:YoaK family protein [Nakamurella sp. PAMC28650]QNK82193.1 DUF1275 domain-containing protein [Nakamurella sp. PAMC28650]